MATRKKRAPKQPVTPARLARVARLYAKGGTPLVMETLGVSNSYARNLITRATETPAENPQSPAVSFDGMTRGQKVVAAKQIGAYLDAVRNAAVNGKTYRPGVVVLGALPGFPQATSDPAVIADAIKLYEKRAQDAPSAIVELKARQKIIDLTAALEVASKSTSDLEANFIANAGAWAAENGISYAAFRTMGIPARVLKAANVGK